MLFFGSYCLVWIFTYFALAYTHFPLMCSLISLSAVLLESPRTLSHICRLRIRRCFTPRQLLTDDAILSLPLPATILDYLLYNQSV